MSAHLKTWHPDNLIQGRRYCFHYQPKPSIRVQMSGVFICMEAAFGTLWLLFDIQGTSMLFDVKRIANMEARS